MTRMHSIRDQHPSRVAKNLSNASVIVVLVLAAFSPQVAGTSVQYLPKAGQKLEYSVSYEFKLTNGTIVNGPFFIEKRLDGDYYITPTRSEATLVGIGNASKFTTEFAEIPNNATWIRATRYYTYRFTNGTEYVDPLPYILQGGDMSVIIEGPTLQSILYRNTIVEGLGFHGLADFFIENETYAVNDVVPGFLNGTVIAANENETVVEAAQTLNYTYYKSGLMKSRVWAGGPSSTLEYYIETLDLVAIINPRTGPPNGPAITGAAVPLILVAVLAVTIGMARRVRKNRDGW